MPLKILKESRTPSERSIKNIIGIAAGKGGVGKSTVSVNLALALQSQGYKVGLMDTDIYGPSVRKMLPDGSLPSQKGAQIFPAEVLGIKFISMAFFRPENEAAVVRAPIANGLILQFIRNVVWGELDFLLLDFPPGTGDIQLTLCQHANLTGGVLVTTPQEVALMDVRKAAHLFQVVKIPIIGIIENMSYYSHPEGGEPIYLFGKGGGTRLSSEVGAPLLGEIPIDEALCRSGDLGESLHHKENEKNNPAVKAFKSTAQLLVNHVRTISKEENGYLEQFELIWKEMK